MPPVVRAAAATIPRPTINAASINHSPGSGAYLLTLRPVKRRRPRSFFLSPVFDLLPVGVEGAGLLELGAVVQIVTFEAFSLRVAAGNPQLHGLPQLGNLLGGTISLAAFRGDVGRAGAVAVLAAVVL